MSGQAGARGYLLQTIYSLLSALRDPNWISVQIEPNIGADKVDIVWRYAQGTKAVQVKSSENQINLSDAKAWAEMLERSISANFYELVLFGPCSDGVANIGIHGQVKIPAPLAINTDALIAQAAHKLDVHLDHRGAARVPPLIREVIVSALIGKLSEYASIGTELSRDGLDHLLNDWLCAIDPGILNRANVPGIRERAQRVIDKKPSGWEFILLSHVLADELQARGDMKRDLQHGTVFGAFERVEADARIFRFIEDQNQVFKMITDGLARIWTEDILREALGPPGVSGDPTMIVYIAKKTGEAYQGLLTWALRWQRLNTDDEIRRELLVGQELVLGYLQGIEDLSSQLESEIERVLHSPKGGVSQLVNIEFNVGSLDVKKMEIAIQNIGQILKNRIKMTAFAY